MEAIALQTCAPTVHWEDNTSCIYVVEAKIVTTKVKHIVIPICFPQEKIYNGALFSNIRSLVSCHQICAPNHVQVQLSARVLNGCLGSDSIHTVIYNNIIP